MKCYFCKKNINKRQYIIKLPTQNLTICSECMYIYGILLKQVSYDRVAIMKKILDVARYGDRHCSRCTYYRSDIEHTCRRGMSTYIGRPTRTHPFSYGQYGCAYFIIAD